MTQQSLSLTILRKGDTNIIDLAEMGSLIPRSETRVDDAFLYDLVTEVTRVTALGHGQDQSPTIIKKLQQIGELIFSHLLTEAARRRLRAAQPCNLYLRLDESLLQVPWELSYDGEQFLTMKFRLGRQVITSAPVPGTATSYRGQGPLRVLLIADPTETLPQAGEEIERLCELLEEIHGVEFTLLGGQAVRKVSLLAALQTHDVVHFAGHSQYDAQTPSQSGWVLHEGVLTAGELSKLARPPLLVFSNSCQAGATAEWKKDYRYEGQAFGIGSAFLLAGVQNYVGTFWVIQDEESTLFATAFYRSLLAGHRIGEALFEARQSIIAQRGWAGLTWASYMLYGDPAVTLLPTTREQALPNVSTPSPLQPIGEMRRKPAAILSADVKGYSRLMGEDEEATIRTLTAYRGVMITLIQQHHGRVVDSPGDNLLAEFVSAVDAVQSAVAIQRELQAKNKELPDSRKMEFRIGINVGDVIGEGERLYGDGVNIAARLEGLAEPGGICLSGTVYDQVGNKLALRYAYVGEQDVKNIAKPVRVYRVVMEDAEAQQVEDSAKQKAKGKNQKSEIVGRVGSVRRRWTTMAAVGLVLLVGTIIAVRYIPFSLLGPRPLILGTERAPALSLPLKPSIAVLPFTNMSGDTEQEYFSDGMTDTLITDLSKLSGLFVIARNSTFVYKGKAIKPQQVSQELGVRYVLEGSVQKAETRVRVNAQLVDATTGQHLWAERYDRDLKDIFALQDELTRRIIGALQVKLTTGEQGRIGRVPTDNLEAYDYFLHGKEYWERATQEANEQARQMFERAIALDPQFALAYTVLSLTYQRAWIWGWNADPQTLDYGAALAEKAHALDDALPEAHILLGLAYAYKGQSEVGLTEGERSIALDPNCAWCHIGLAEVLLLTGQPEEALGLVEKASRLDPESAFYHSFHLGWAYRLLGRYEEALAAQKRALTRNPDFLPAHMEMVRLYNELGQEKEARIEAAEVRRINPNAPLELSRGKASLNKQRADSEGFLARSSARAKAFGYLVGGSSHFLRFTQEENTQAQQMWKKATELDPHSVEAHAALGVTYLYEWIFQWSQDPQTLEQALTLARKAVALDDSSPLAHQLLSVGYMYKKQYEQAIVEAERALTLDPAVGDAYVNLGVILAFAGQPEEAIKVVEKGMHLNSRIPASPLSTLGIAYYSIRQYEKALDVLKKALPLTPNWLPTHLYLAVIYGELGREKEAQVEAAEILRLSPNFSLEVLKQRSTHKDPGEIERVLAALRKAGLK